MMSIESGCEANPNPSKTLSAGRQGTRANGMRKMEDFTALY